MLVEKIHRTLPIFRYCEQDQCVIYTPGYYSPVDKTYSETLKLMYHDPSKIRPDTLSASMIQLGNTFIQHAEMAHQKWQQWLNNDYTPECITVHLSNNCNLNCQYCYSKTELRLFAQNGQTSLPVVSISNIQKAAEIVARNCQKNSKQFHLVMHGGGEPTLHWPTLKKTVELTQHIAKRQGIAWFGYIATHGVLSQEKASWIAAHFSQVGLSCDGPPDIQNAQRPKLNNGNTSENLERTAEILRHGKVTLSVRATITSESYNRQVDIVEYIAKQLGANDIRFEASYENHAFTVQQVSSFVDHYLAARQKAEELNCNLQMSGVRLDELHGPFCNMQKNVLQITPEGFISACFRNSQGDEDQLTIGAITEHAIEFDNSRITQLQHQLALPIECKECINAYHCSRNCPEICPLENTNEQWSGGFRCLVNKLITYNELKSLITS